MLWTKNLHFSEIENRKANYNVPMTEDEQWNMKEKKKDGRTNERADSLPEID